MKFLIKKQLIGDFSGFHNPVFFLQLFINYLKHHKCCNIADNHNLFQCYFAFCIGMLQKLFYRFLSAPIPHIKTIKINGKTSKLPKIQSLKMKLQFSSENLCCYFSYKEFNQQLVG